MPNPIFLKTKEREIAVKIAKTREEIEACLRLRYEVFCAEDKYKYLNIDAYPDGLEIDDWDDHSVHFLAIDDNGEAVVSARLIKSNPKPLRVEDYVALSLPREQTMEISRLCMKKEFRGTMSGARLMLYLYKVMYDYSIERRVRYWVGTMFPGTWKLLLHQGMCFTFIGEKSFWPKDSENVVYPVMLDLDSAETYLNHHNHKLYTFFTGKDDELSKNDPGLIQILERIQEDLSEAGLQH